MEHYRSEPDSVVEYDSQLGDNTVLGKDDQAHIENKSGDLGLHGPIPSTTYRSKSRLAASFGLDSSAALKDWMDSKAFKCYYSDLLASLQKYVSAEDMKKLRRGLRLTLVQDTLKEGEQCGHCKFSARHGIKLETFSAIDFYALFLFLVVDYNSLDGKGAFFGKRMSVEYMQSRVWQAMLRASLEDTTRRSREEQTTGQASSSMGSDNGEAGKVTEATGEP